MAVSLSKLDLILTISFFTFVPIGSLISGKSVASLLEAPAMERKWADLSVQSRNCATVTASVSKAPGATLTIRRRPRIWELSLSTQPPTDTKPAVAPSSLSSLSPSLEPCGKYGLIFIPSTFVAVLVALALASRVSGLP